MRWMDYIACMGERRAAYRFWWENLRKGDHLENPNVVERYY
jgi:hypothetical protein